MTHKTDKLNGLLKAEKLVSDSRELGVVFVVVSKIINTAKEGNLKEQPKEIQKLLAEFADLVSDSLPQGLPPMRSIQHDIDLVSEHLYRICQHMLMQRINIDVLKNSKKDIWCWFI